MESSGDWSVADELASFKGLTGESALAKRGELVHDPRYRIGGSTDLPGPSEVAVSNPATDQDAGARA